MKKVLILLAFLLQVSVMGDEISQIDITYHDDYDYYTMGISGNFDAPMQIFLDIDNNENTGYTNGEIRGADRLIEIYDLEEASNQVYTYEGGNNSSWEWSNRYQLSNDGIWSENNIFYIDLDRWQLGMDGEAQDDRFNYHIQTWDSSWNEIMASYPNEGMQEYNNNNVELSTEQITKQFTNLFERGDKNDFGYNTAIYLDDAEERGLTVGMIFTTGTSTNDFYGSDAYQVIQRYVDTTNDPDEDFTQIANKNYNGDFDSMLDTIKEKWSQLGSDDQNFQSAQDYIFAETTYQPAVTASNKLKGSPLTILNLQNAYVLHGPGEDEDSTDGMIHIASNEDEYYEFESIEDEKEWLRRFIKVRGKEFCSDDEHRKALSILSTLEDLVDEYDKYHNLGNNFMDRVEQLRNQYEDIYTDENEIQLKCDAYEGE